MNSKIIISIIFYYFGILCSYGQNPIPTRDYQVDLENEAVSQYMRDVVYKPHDKSLIDNYRKDLQYRGDWPNPVVMNIPKFMAYYYSIVCCDDETLKDSLIYEFSAKKDTVELYNLIPNRIYRYQIKNEDDVVLQQGKIYTSGQLRQIKVCSSVTNVRDLGGWKTVDNMQICYGKIIRGSELNGIYSATYKGMNRLYDLGIEAELDLRADYNKSHGISAFGFTNDTSSGEIPTYYYSSDSGQLPSNITDSVYLDKWKLAFQFIVDNLRQGRVIYQHCVYGKDRTGYLSFLLEGLLGVSYSDLVKEYELSFFINKTESTKDSIDKVFDYIETMDGATLRDRFNTFFVSKIQAKQDDIDFFRSEMLEAIKPNDNAVRNIENDLVGINKERIYDLTGRVITTPKSGNIYLVRDKYGHTRKIVYQ